MSIIWFGGNDATWLWLLGAWIVAALSERAVSAGRCLKSWDARAPVGTTEAMGSNDHLKSLSRRTNGSITRVESFSVGGRMTHRTSRKTVSTRESSQN